MDYNHRTNHQLDRVETGHNRRSNPVGARVSQNTNPRGKMWFWLSFVATLALFAGAVYATASVAKLSYLSAQYQQQEIALQQQQQRLQERLAAAQSLTLPVAYAKEAGLIAGVSNSSTVLDMAPELASANITQQ